MPVVDDYRLRYSVQGAQAAERTFRKTGEAVQQALQRATDPKASQRNLRLLDQELDKAERELVKMRTALQPMPGGLQALDRGARAAGIGLASMSAAVPGLGALSAVMMGPAGIVAGVGLLAGAVVSAVPRVVGELSGVADTAERIGISAESFQELRGAMLLMTEDANALTPALQRLLEVTGQAAMGIGEGATAFRDMGLEARTAEGQVKTLDQLLPEIADKMQQAGSQAERLALAQRLFGEQGRAFVRVLEQGSTGLTGLRDAAREAGVVINEEMVEAARAADAELKLANAQIDTATDKLVIAFAPAVSGAATVLADFVGWVTDGVTELGRFDAALEMVTGEADVTAAGVKNLAGAIEELEKRRAIRANAGATDEQLAGIDALIAQRREQLAFAQTQLALSGPPAPFTPPADSVAGGPVLPRARPPEPPRRSLPGVRVRTGTATLATVTPVNGESLELLQFKERLKDVGDTAASSADTIRTKFAQALGSAQTALDAMGVSADSAFGRVVGGALTGLQQVNALINAATQLAGLFNNGSGGGSGLGSALFSLGSSILGAGTTAQIGADLGLTTGNFGGAQALAGGVSAAGALGVGGFATGGVFQGGMVVSKPTVAPMALFGEAGPEAIMPLARGPDGSLGVRSAAIPGGGGQSGNVYINVQNTAAGVAVEPRERRQQDGSVQIDLIVRQVEQRLAAGVQSRQGDLSRALRSEFAGRGG